MLQSGRDALLELQKSIPFVTPSILKRSLLTALTIDSHGDFNRYSYYSRFESADGIKGDYEGDFRTSMM